MALNEEAEVGRVSDSRTNMRRFRPPPLQQLGGSFTSRGGQAKGSLSPLGKPAEGIVSPFARAQVQPKP